MGCERIFKVRRISIAALLLFVVYPAIVFASPAACFRNEVSMFLVSDAVVEAKVTSSRRWSQGRAHNLVAKYKIIQVYKGDLHKNDIMIVTDSCLEARKSRELAGYPTSITYCPKGYGVGLSGVNRADGTPIKTDGIAVFSIAMAVAATASVPFSGPWIVFLSKPLLCLSHAKDTWKRIWFFMGLLNSSCQSRIHFAIGSVSVAIIPHLLWSKAAILS